MNKEDKHLSGAGLADVWAKCKAYFLAKSGGTLTGKLTISAGGIEVSGGSSSFHSSIYFDQGFGVASYDDNDDSVSLLSYSTGNIAAIAYGNASKGVTRIFGKSLVLYTNGWNARMTIGEDGNVAFSGAISEGGTLISTKYTYTAGTSIDITSNVVKVSMTATSDPTASGDAISFIDTISQDTAGKISVTKKNVQAATASASGVVTTEAQTFAGNKTFNGTTLFANNVTIKKSSSATTPLTIATSASTGDNANRAAIKFEKNDETALGYIGCRIVNNVKEPYFNGGSYQTIWHKGIAGTSTTDWACKDLTVAGDLGVTGASTLASLGVTGNTTIGGTLGVTGATAMSGRITMTNSDGQIRFNPNTSSGTTYEEISVGASNNGGYIWGYTIAKAYMRFKNGYVGVFNNNPACALDVTGDICASGGVAASGIADLRIY